MIQTARKTFHSNVHLHSTCFFLVFFIFFNSFFSFIVSYEIDEEGLVFCSSRYSFPTTCKKHFTDNITTYGSWMEADDKDTILGLSEYLSFIPQGYEADCFHCSDCNGVNFNLYHGCDYPTDYGPEIFTEFHTKTGRGLPRDCKGQAGHCKSLCWNGGYFRRWNHKYIHFFHHFLKYCSENPECDCFWPEINKRASNINNSIYDLLKDLANNSFILPEFSPYWKGTSYFYNYGKKINPVEQIPNDHGMASSLTTYTFFYSQYHQMLLAVIEFIDAQAIPGSSKITDKIYANLENLHADFSFLYNRCLKWHPHPKIYYERGMLKMHEGDFEGALTDISRLMHSAKELRLNESHLTSAMYQQEGQVYNELGMYDQAIQTLTKAIEQDPTNRGAYFNRAQAYFESGEFDSSIQDYISSNIHESYKTKLKPPVEIKEAILNGLLEGSKEAAVNFFPSLCQSTYGLGTSLWTFIEHPIDSTTNFVNTCYDISKNVSDFFKNIDLSNTEFYVEEIARIQGNFDRYSESEKAHLTAYLIGKYGVDIFAGGTTVKSVALCKKLKDANRIANLEAISISKKCKEAMKTSASTHAAKREAFFKNVKVHLDKQNKHVPGKHNYIEGRSIFEHPNAQELVDKFAGKGIPLAKRMPGSPDYREKVNFGEFIGYHVDEKTKIKTPTTFGELRYSKTGVHIVPTFPD